MTFKDAKAIVTAYRGLEAAARKLRETIVNAPSLPERPPWELSELIETVTCHPLVVYARGIDAGFTMGAIATSSRVCGIAGDILAEEEKA